MMRKVLCILVALLMIVTMVPTAAFAEETQPVVVAETAAAESDTQETQPPAPTDVPAPAPTPTEVPVIVQAPADTDAPASDAPTDSATETVSPTPSESAPLPTDTPAITPSAEAQAVINAIAALPANITWADFDAVEQAGVAYLALADQATVTNTDVLMQAAAKLYVLYAEAVSTLPAEQNVPIDPIIMAMNAQIENSTFIRSVAPDTYQTTSATLMNAKHIYDGLETTSEASINGKLYATLTEALAAVKANDVVVINKDITTTTGYTCGITSVSFTIDFNDKTITGNLTNTSDFDSLFSITKGNVTFANGSIVLNSGDCAVAVASANATLTIANGTYTAAEGFAVAALGGTVNISGGSFSSNDSRGVVLSYGGTLNITGGTFEATNTDGSCVYVGDRASTVTSTANISGGTFNSVKYGVFILKNSRVAFNGGTINITGAGQAICGNGESYGNIDVTINDVTVNVSSIDKTGCGVYAPSFSNLTINDATFNVDGNCLELKAGNTRINGGNFTAHGTNASPNYGNSGGPSGSSNCIDVIGNTAYSATSAISLAIKGGYFSSDAGSAVRMDNVTTNAKDLSTAIYNGTFVGSAATLNNLLAASNMTIVKATSNTAIDPAKTTLGTTSYFSGDHKKVYASFDDMLNDMGIANPIAVTGSDRFASGTSHVLYYNFTDALLEFVNANGLEIHLNLWNKSDSQFSFGASTDSSVNIIAPTTNQPATATLTFIVHDSIKNTDIASQAMQLMMIPSTNDATSIDAIDLLALSATTDLHRTDKSMRVPIRYIVNGVDLDTLDGTRLSITSLDLKDAKTGKPVPGLTVFLEGDEIVLDVANSVTSATTFSVVVSFGYKLDGTGDERYLNTKTLTVKVNNAAAKFTIKQLSSIDVFRNNVDGVDGKYSYYKVPLSVSANVASIDAQGSDPEFTVEKGTDNIFYLKALTTSKLTAKDKRLPLFTVSFNDGYTPVSDYKLPVTLTSITPTLKLTASSVNALRAKDKTSAVGLVSSNAKIAFSSLRVDTDNIKTDLPSVFGIAYDDGILTLNNLVDLTADKYAVKVLVPFTDSKEVLTLSLNVACKAPLTVKLPSSSVTLNLWTGSRLLTIPLTVAPSTETVELESVNGQPVSAETKTVTIGQLNFGVESNNLLVEASGSAIPAKAAVYLVKFKDCATANKLSITVVQKANTAKLSQTSVTLNKTLTDSASVSFIMSDGRLVDNTDIALSGQGFVASSIAAYSIDGGVIKLNVLSTAPAGIYKIQIEDKSSTSLNVVKMPVLTVTVSDTPVKLTVKLSGSLDTLNVNKPLTATVSLSGTTSVSLKSVLSTLTDDDFTLISANETTDLPVHIVPGSYNAAKGTFLIAWNDVTAIMANAGLPVQFSVQCKLTSLHAKLVSTLTKSVPAQGAFKLSTDTVALYKNAPYMIVPISFKLANGYTGDMIASVTVPVSSASAHYSISRTVNGGYTICYRGASNSWLTKAKTESVKLNVMLKGAAKPISCTLSVNNIMP